MQHLSTTAFSSTIYIYKYIYRPIPIWKFRFGMGSRSIQKLNVSQTGMFFCKTHGVMDISGLGYPNLELLSVFESNDSDHILNWTGLKSPHPPHSALMSRMYIVPYRRLGLLTMVSTIWLPASWLLLVNWFPVHFQSCFGMFLYLTVCSLAASTVSFSFFSFRLRLLKLMHFH